MKSTGIIRKLDDLGRIVLPVEIRRTLELDVNSRIEIFTDENRVILMKYRESCIFCGSEDGLTEFKNHTVCASCREELARSEQAAQ